MRITELPEQERLIQLAEECSELAQASLKLVRALNGQTPVSEEQARKDWIEEMGDVAVCMKFMMDKATEAAIQAVADYKTERWENRLNNVVTV